MKRRVDRRRINLLTHVSGPPLVVFSRPEVAVAGKARPTGVLSSHDSDGDPRTFLAYKEIIDFQKQQRGNGHLAAEMEILGGMMERDYVGETIVSLACGSGWLERELVKKREVSLTKDERSKLYIVGVDSSMESISYSNVKMLEMIRGNRNLNECYNNGHGRLRFQYINAMLGGRAKMELENGKMRFIQSFANIDLENTVIGSPSPDTIIAFYALTLWVHEREAAIRAIARKCRKEGFGKKATIMISGEEYPIHITPNPFMTLDFKHAVEERRMGEMSPEEIWDGLFSKNGLIRVSQGQVPFGLPSENHVMKYAILKFFGKD